MLAKIVSGMGGALTLILASVGCGGATTLSSAWPPTNVTIDGETQEWNDQFVVFDDGNVDIGVYNDAEFLYVSLIPTTDEMRRQIERQGLIVWLDTSGEKKQDLGIRYPVGLKPEQMATFRPAPGSGRTKPSPSQIESMQKVFQESLGELELLRGDDNAQRLNIDDVKGLEVSVQTTAARLSYEIKIPFTSNEPGAIAINAKPGDEIALGIQTPEIDREAMRDQMSGRGHQRPGGGGRSRGGMGGGGDPGGAGRGGRGARGGFGGPPIPDPVNAWVMVQLVEASAATTSDPSKLNTRIAGTKE